MPEVNVLMGQQKPKEVEANIRLKQADIPKGLIKPRMLEGGLAAMKFGLAADIPDTGAIYPVYFSLDTAVLSIWDGTQWRTVNLT